MKKRVTILACLLLLGAIFASGIILADNDKGNSDNSYGGNYENEKGYQNGSAYEYEIRERKMIGDKELEKILRERNELRIKNRLNQSECPLNCSCEGSSMKCQFENGSREMIIRAGQSGNQIIQVKNVNASTQVRLYRTEDGEVYGTFRNNETRKIILPDEARARIEAELRERIRLHNENITLDENGIYQIRAEKRARFLFLFPVNESIKYNIDAETGEVIKHKRVWWGFLARDIREEMMNETNSTE